MKIKVINNEGKKIKEKTTLLFEEPIREDIIFKIIEAEKVKHPNSNKFRAGMDRSASGLLKKTRKVWKSDRGKGLTRIPRKIMSRRGTQFNWIGAIIPSVRGGRRAHPPKGDVNLTKINKKELKKALLSTLTYVADKDELIKKYDSLKGKQISIELPLVIEGKFTELKTKEILLGLKKILGEDMYNVSIQKRTVRPGKGKIRGRKNKKNRGLLIVIGNKEKMKTTGIDVIKVHDLTVTDMAANGARITIFTENAIEDLERIAVGKPEKKTK